VTVRAEIGDAGGDLVRALAGGRATLLVGQRHSPGFLDGLKQDIAAVVGRSGNDLIELLSGVIGDPSIEGLRRVLEARPASPELVKTADNPWSYVLTSAIDPQVHEAFRRPVSSGRQLRVFFAGSSGTLARTGPATLTLLRLFGALDEIQPAYRPPETSLELRRRTRLELPIVLNELPYMIGPGGHLVVTGVGSDDWLDLETLALSCTDLPKASIHWFDAPEQRVSLDELQQLFGNRLRHHSNSLTDELQFALETDEGVLLQRAREQLLHPSARRITVRRGGSPVVVTFSPEEWRRLTQVAIVLDDEVTEPPPPHAVAEERQAFRDFLYRVQRVPDWTGVARGFIFERDAAQSLLALVEGELATPRSVHASDSSAPSDATERSSRRSILIEGAPASGKTRLLHWLAFHLRLAGHVVAFVFPTRGRTSFEQVERACRLLEDRTKAPVAVIVDNLEASDYEALSEVLASSGRRSVVIGALSTLRSRAELAGLTGFTDEFPRPRASYVPFALSSTLGDQEADRFLDFLVTRGFSEIPLARDVIQQRLFLLLLYRLLPDSRGNIHLAVGQEYERLVTALERQLETDSDEPTQETDIWRIQLAALRAQLFPDLEAAAPPTESPFRHDPEVAGAVQLSLLCSLIERPIALDLLLRTQGQQFLSRYTAFSRAMDETALLQETLLDAEGTIGIEAEHPFVADVALRTLIPDRATQLALLALVVKAIHWDESAMPGENVDQDYAVSVLQAVGPRGASAERFTSARCMQQLVDLLREIRVIRQVRLPSLLLLEANALRLLTNVDTSSLEDALSRYQSAIEILNEAEQLLTARRPSASRSSQLQSILTTRGVVHGYICGAVLRQYAEADAGRRSSLRRILEQHLDEVNSDTIRARSIGGATYFPLDVSFWAHRDQLERIPDLTDAERVSLLAKLESVLDMASEEPIEQSQFERYQRRLVDLAQLQGQVQVAESLASELRARGDFSADCVLARRKAIDPITRRIRSAAVAREVLNGLLGFAPKVLGSEEALSLMHHLWIGANLEGQVLGGEQPVFARCTRSDWLTWQRILENRLALPANTASPYLNFCLAWTLLELDESLKAMQVLRSNEVLAAGNRRRVGALVVITDNEGNPIEYSGTVRRLDGQLAVLYVPRLLGEIRASARVQAALSTSVHIGDEWRFGLSANYQGVLPWPISQGR